MSDFELAPNPFEAAPSNTKLNAQLDYSTPPKPVDNYLSVVKPNIDAKSWLEIGKVRGREITKQQDETRNAVVGIATGQAEKDIQTQMKDSEDKIVKLIDSMGQSFINPTENSVSQQIDNDIASMQRALDSGDYTKYTNPKTGQPYTAQDYQAEIKHAKSQRYIDAGVATNPFEAGATVLLQLLFPDQRTNLAGAAEQLRQNRFEMTKDNAVRAFQAQKEKNQAMLGFLSNKYQDLKEMYKYERDWTERKASAVWENNQALERLNLQLTNGNWETATKEADDIVQNLSKLPPEQIEAAMLRYNNLASFANRLNSLGMKVYTSDEVKAVVHEGKLRERDRVITQVVNQMLVQRNNWETATPDDIAKFDAFLKAFGPQLDPNTGKERVLTVKDLPIVTAFNRLKPKTQEEIRSHEAGETIRRETNQTRENIANQNNQTKRDVAAQRKAGKTDKDAVQRKRLEDTVKEKQILFGGASQSLSSATHGKSASQLSLYEKNKYKSELTAFNKAQADLNKAKAALEARTTQAPKQFWFQRFLNTGKKKKTSEFEYMGVRSK